MLQKSSIRNHVFIQYNQSLNELFYFFIIFTSNVPLILILYRSSKDIRLSALQTVHLNCFKPLCRIFPYMLCFSVSKGFERSKYRFA